MGFFDEEVEIVREGFFLAQLVVLPFLLAFKLLQVFLPPLITLMARILILIRKLLWWLAKKLYHLIRWLTPRGYRLSCRFCRATRARILKGVSRLQKRFVSASQPSLE